MTRFAWTAIALLVASVACSNTADPSASTSAADMASGTTPTFPQSLVETPIVTTADDPNLINAWGLSFASSGLAWISDNGTGLASVYPAKGAPAKLTVRIPAPPGAMGPSAPTGNVANTDSSEFKGDKFIFVTEDGTIAGWQGGEDAVLRVDNAGMAVYKGVAIHLGNKTRRTRLYATNFFAATVDVFDGNYEPVKVKGAFVDDQIPAGYAPFNVLVSSTLGVLVTYAKQNAEKHDDVKGPGHGFVDLFDFEGNLLTRLISRGPLDSPWGLAFAPDKFGNISDTLLVGNFGDGLINVFAIKTKDEGKNKEKDASCPNGSRVRAEFLGPIGDAESEGDPLRIEGLWSIVFGVDAGGFSSHTLYFTAGPIKETLGAFGMLTLPTMSGN